MFYCDNLSCTQTIPCTIHTKQEDGPPVKAEASDGKGEEELPEAAPLVRSITCTGGMKENEFC